MLACPTARAVKLSRALKPRAERADAEMMGQESAWELAGLIVIVSLIGGPLLVLIHELGHAIAIRLRGLPLHSIVVGNSDDLTFRLGRVVVRLGRLLHDEAGGGYVTHDVQRASARDIIVIALAGPLANLATAPLFAALALAGDGSSGLLDIGLWYVAVLSMVSGVANLVPFGSSSAPSDGRWIQLAWARRHIPVTDWITAAPPALPPTPRPSPEPGTGMRWPFLAVLILVAVVGFAVAGVAALVLLVAVFGVALLNGAHRDKLR